MGTERGGREIRVGPMAIVRKRDTGRESRVTLKDTNCAPATMNNASGHLSPAKRAGRKRASNVVSIGRNFPIDIARLDDHQTAIPKIAKDAAAVARIETHVKRLKTSHLLYHGDARELGFIKDRSVHLILTSPPYWTLKEYRNSDGQMGHIDNYAAFILELNRVWEHCYRVLVPGGRLVCVVGDVCLSRRKNGGEHTVVPLHASIQVECKNLGFSNLAPIIWYKIANAKYEAQGNGAGFLGKPYEPNSVVKNDIEFILMERKPGGYRSPSIETRVLSVISGDQHKEWFQQIWSGVTGASTRNHPAPYPLELAERLIRMFSFVGDTVLDPFMGTGTTNLAAATWGRNSIGVEIDDHYFGLAKTRIAESEHGLHCRLSFAP
jgi:DNA modification methylase